MDKLWVGEWNGDAERLAVVEGIWKRVLDVEKKFWPAVA